MTDVIIVGAGVGGTTQDRHTPATYAGYQPARGSTSLSPCGCG